MAKGKEIVVKEKGGKRIRAVRLSFDKEQSFVLNDAVDIVRKNANAKFDETLEVALNLGVDPRHSDQMVRGIVPLPNGTGKQVRIAVFARGDKAEEAKKSGADIVGAEDLVEKIKAGDLSFDRCIATPDMMALVGSVAKILGPRGLMPNPKLGTVTPNVVDAINAAKSGQVEFRVDKAGIIHAGVGKVSFTVDALIENIKALVLAVNKAKPSGVKGSYFKTAVLSSTMGPAVKVELASILA